jgi:hypothetical protein
MKTCVLFTRHSVRGGSDEIIINNENERIQKYSGIPLPLYSSPVNENQNINEQGWRLSRKLGKYLRKKYSNINIRTDVKDTRTINTGIGIARGAKVPTIQIYNGKLDPLSDYKKIFNIKYKNSEYFEKTYKELYPFYQNVSRPILNKIFKTTLPDINEELFDLYSKLSYHGIASHYSHIDLGINKDDLYVLIETQSKKYKFNNNIEQTQIENSTPATYILNKLKENNKNLNIFVTHDDKISNLMALFQYKFQNPKFPEGYVNFNSGVLFCLKNNKVKIEWLGLTLKGKYIKTPIISYSSLEQFEQYLNNRIDTKYVNMDIINNISNYRVN